MILIFQIIILTSFLVILAYLKQIRKRRKEPPGPLGLPFFGERPLSIIKYLFPRFFTFDSEVQYYTDMKKKYGDIWSLDFGGRKIVVLASVEMIQDLFHDKAKQFSGRQVSEAFKEISQNKGISFVDGETPDENRHIGFKALREFGSGKSILENYAKEEIHKMMENIDKRPSKYITCPEIFIKPLCNLVYQLTFLKRSNNEDTEFENIVDDFHVLFHSNEANDIIETFVNILPKSILRKLFPKVDKFFRSANRSIKYMEKQCRERLEIESEFSKPSCIFDYYWRYRYQDYPQITREERIADISHSMFDIFLGGMDTSANILSFGCLFLGQFGDLQKEIRNELQEQTDNYQMIDMKMRNNCPKLLSFMEEINRFCVLCERMIRRAPSDCVFRNYAIRSTDMIIADQVSSMRDPTLYKNPNVFDPYRFLDESKTKFVPNAADLTFGTGRRSCLGRNMGEMQTYLFLSSIILKYDIKLPKETKDHLDEIIEGCSGLVHSPLKHEIIFHAINYDKD